MSRVVSMMSLVGLTMAVTVGCGDTPTDAPAQASESRTTSVAVQPATGQSQPVAEPTVGPDKVVGTFLEAVRSGDDQTAAAMLTPLALERTAEHELSVAPPGSPTAEFTVGDINYVDGGGAHVASTWSDVNDAGDRRTDTLVWMLRREQAGWRIAGLGTVVFPDQPPLFLNFEDPEDMLDKQRLTEEEMARRAAATGPAANASTSLNSAAARQAQVPQQPAQRQAQLPPSGAATPRR